MTVKDLIKKLQEFDPDLPVALEDWNEDYDPPSIDAAEDISLGWAPMWSNTPRREVPAVILGRKARQ